MVYEWLISNYQWLISTIVQIAVAFGTIYLARMAYRQMQASNVKIHTSNLKDMVRLWQQQSLPETPPAEETGNPNRFYALNPSFIIENHSLFEDIFHHFPSLKNAWNDFKTLSTNYSSERQALFGEIEEHIKQKLKVSNFNFESEIKEGFPVSVYMESIIIAKNKISEYDYFTEKVAVDGVGGIRVEKIRLIYRYRGNTYGHNLADIDPREIEEVKGIHKELIKECKEQYIDKIKEIIEMESKTRDSYNKLKSTLDKITFRTVFPKMDCMYVK